MKSRSRNIKMLFVDLHPLTKLFFLLFGMLSIVLILTFLGMLLAIPLFDLTMNDINVFFKNNFEVADSNLIKYFQGVQSVGLFVIPGLVFWYLFFNSSGPANQLHKKKYVLGGITILLTTFSLVPIIGLLVKWNSDIHFPSNLHGLETTLQKLESDAAVLTEKILEGVSIRHYLFSLLVVAILPAIGEEFIFRGIVQQIVISWMKNSHVAILLTSIIFSAVHLQFYGFVPRLFLGIYFGYIFLWSRNIWLSVLAHLFNNTLAVSVHFLIIRNIYVPAYFSEESLSWSKLILGATLSFLFILLTWVITKQSGNKDTSYSY